METMKKIEVTAVFYPNGEMRPLQFTWQKRTFHVQGTGRQWQEGDQQQARAPPDQQRPRGEGAQAAPQRLRPEAQRRYRPYYDVTV